MFSQVSVSQFVGILGAKSLLGRGRYPWLQVQSAGGGVGIPGPSSILGGGGRYPWPQVPSGGGYCHLVVATEAGSTHPTGMLSC